MKNNLILLQIIFLLVVFTSDSHSKKYLSNSELLKIGSASASLAIVGYISENQINESRSSLIDGPILFDRYFQKQIGGNLSTNSHKTNFLDSRKGAVLTPAISLTILILTDYSHYSVKRNNQILQDCYLFSTGLMATVGITGLFKGLVARERPVYYEQKQKGIIFKDDYKRSFFSGHTSLAFYSMHYLNRRLNSIMRKNNSSRKFMIAKTFICYGWAGYVSVSRIHASKHYATDVIVGAGVGLLMSDLFFRFGENKKRKFSLSASHSKVVIRYSF